MTRGRVKGCASASTAVGVCLDSAPTLAWKVQFCAVSTTGNSNDNNNNNSNRRVYLAVGSVHHHMEAEWERQENVLVCQEIYPDL